MGEIIICPVEHNAATREYIEGYFADKWGLQANLPGGHTYEEHYDSRHRLIRVDHGFGETEDYAYEGDNPEPVSITD